MIKTDILRKYGFRSLGFFIFFFILINSDWNDILSQFRNLNLLNIGLILLLCLPGIGLKALRWYYLLRLQNIKLSFLRVWLFYTYAIGVGFLSPGRIGEFSKVIFIKSENNISLSRSTVSVIVERCIDFLILIWLMCTGILYYIIDLGSLLSWGITTISLIIIFIIIYFFSSVNKKYFYCIKCSDKNHKLKLFRRTVFNTIGVFVIEMKSIFKLKFSIVIALSFLSIIVQFYQFMLFAIQLDLNINIFQTGFALTLVGISSMLPISIMGLGTREAVLIFAFGLYGLNRSDSISYSIMIFSIQIVMSLTIVGILSPFIYINDKNRKIYGTEN